MSAPKRTRIEDLVFDPPGRDDPRPPLPQAFDYVDLGMLLDLIEDLSRRVPAYSMDAAEGDNEACDRARAALSAYRPAT